MKSDRAQVWIETVLYILIGLTLIGVTLAIVTPKISQAKDKIVVEQSIEALNVLDEKIREVADRGQGNSRVVSFLIKRGKMSIDPSIETIRLEISDLGKPFSEEGVRIKIGEISVLTTNVGSKSYRVALTLDYSDVVNLTYLQDDSSIKEFNAAVSPYNLVVANVGRTDSSDPSQIFTIDIKEAN